MDDCIAMRLHHRRDRRGRCDIYLQITVTVHYLLPPYPPDASQPIWPASPASSFPAFRIM
jgi:hypothetical protein